MSITLDSKIPDGPLADKWDSYKADAEAGQPDQQAQVQDHRRRHRPRRRVGRGDARRARLPGEGVHLPRLAPPGPLDRRPGRHQRGEELPGRRRQRPPAVLRHRQGRRLPRPRGQRVPPRRGVASTSSTRWSPRACRSPASTAACSTTAASAARRSAARSTPAARPASSCCSAPTSSSPARSASATSSCTTACEMVDVVVDRRPLRRHRHPRPDDRRVLSRTPPTPSCSPPAATATSSSCRPTPWPATSRRRGGPTAGRVRSPTRATRRSTRRASRRPTTSSRSSR